jgi:hypothetical protein
VTDVDALKEILRLIREVRGPPGDEKDARENAQPGPDGTTHDGGKTEASQDVSD